MSVTSGAQLLEQLLASGIGEIAILRQSNGGFVLMHRDDRSRDDLQPVSSAQEVARFDDDGRYRPLKTAPNLRHGWTLRVVSADQVASAIDDIYPGRIAALQALRANELRTTSLRETLARQTGMYRVAARISDEEIDELVGSFCRSDGGCLRTILWKRDSSGALPTTKLPPQKFDAAAIPVPLPCQEACNLLIAAAREVVKADA